MNIKIKLYVCPDIIRKLLKTFFFIPLFGLQQVIVPMISYNHVAKKESRVNQIVHDSLTISYFFMALGVIAFWLIPAPLMSIFHTDSNVLKRRNKK